MLNVNSSCTRKYASAHCVVSITPLGLNMCRNMNKVLQKTVICPNNQKTVL